MKIENAIKQTKFENSLQKAMINLFFTANWFRDKQQAMFEEFDVLPQHFNILRIIKGKHPMPVCPGGIKEVMIDKSPDLTRLLDKLVKKGLVERKLCDINRRKMDITLTASGLILLEEMNAKIKRVMEEINVNITMEEAETLSNLLDKMRN